MYSIEFEALKPLVSIFVNKLFLGNCIFWQVVWINVSTPNVSAVGSFFYILASDKVDQCSKAMLDLCHVGSLTTYWVTEARKHLQILLVFYILIKTMVAATRPQLEDKIQRKMPILGVDNMR